MTLRTIMHKSKTCTDGSCSLLGNSVTRVRLHSHRHITHLVAFFLSKVEGVINKPRIWPFCGLYSLSRSHTRLSFKSIGCLSLHQRIALLSTACRHICNQHFHRRSSLPSSACPDISNISSSYKIWSGTRNHGELPLSAS